MPQIALRWLLQKDVVTSVIIGARNLQQLDDNMSAANGWKLTSEEVRDPLLSHFSFMITSFILLLLFF